MKISESFIHLSFAASADNTLLDLHIFSDDTKAEFIIAKYILALLLIEVNKKSFLAEWLERPADLFGGVNGSNLGGNVRYLLWYVVDSFVIFIINNHVTKL